MKPAPGVGFLCYLWKFKPIRSTMSEESRKLYPLRFIEEGIEKKWGRVSYKVADLGIKESMIQEGWLGGSTLPEAIETYLERLVGDDVFEVYGLQFPLMVKTLDVRGRQPLMVNAPDDAAFERYDSLGKTALWYVLEADRDALIYLGFSKDMDAGELYSRCASGTIEEVLNAVHPHAGDAFLIKPGTVFSAGQGLKIVEISECSELTFSIHDWGDGLSEGEELLLEEALDLIEYSSAEPVPVRGSVLAEIPQFKVTELKLSAPLQISSEQPGSFTLYTCAKGGASIQVPQEEENGSLREYPLKAGQSLLVPAEVDTFFLVPTSDGTVLLESLVEHQDVQDEEVPVETDDEEDPHVKTWS